MDNFTEQQSITFQDTVIYPIYFAIYFLVTMFSQISVLVLVIFKTPSFFRDFRIFLVNSSILQILMCLTICFTQVRPVMNPDSCAFLFSGYCRLFHKNVCFFTFDGFQLIFDASSFSIPVTLYYKYSKVTVVGGQELSRAKVRLILGAAYILSIVVGVIYVLTYRADESLAVELETKKHYANLYVYTKYAQITGYQDHFWSSLTNYLNMSSIYIPPVCSFTFLRMIQIELNRLKHILSDKTAAQAKKFDLALTIQTLVPAICIIPVYSFHIVVDGLYVAPFPAHEKVLYLLLSLPTAIDAFIVIVTITPYRVAFFQFFKPRVPCSPPVPPASQRRVNVSHVTSLF